MGRQISNSACRNNLGTAVPEALRHYERGFSLAWGPVRRWESDPGTDRAPQELAEGHVVLMVAMLSALTAYLTRGRGDPQAKARILREIRESPRLGSKVADWVAANEDKLARHPPLKPKDHQVMMSSQAKPPSVPPVTPSQLRHGSAPANVDTPSAPLPVPKTVAPDLGRKLDYFLGKATGNAHNIERSTGMLRQLETVGLPDNPSTRQYLTEHLGSVVNDPANIVLTQANGRVVRESLVVGPNGVVKLESVWEGAKLITGTLLGGR